MTSQEYHSMTSIYTNTNNSKHRCEHTYSQLILTNFSTFTHDLHIESYPLRSEESERSCFSDTLDLGVIEETYGENVIFLYGTEKSCGSRGTHCTQYETSGNCIGYRGATSCRQYEGHGVFQLTVSVADKVLTSAQIINSCALRDRLHDDTDAKCTLICT